MKDTPDSIPTYGAVFAIFLITLVIVILGYTTLQGVLTADPPQENSEEPATPGLLVHTDKTVLYENLSNEEADIIINQLLQSGGENLEEIQGLEETLLQ